MSAYTVEGAVLAAAYIPQLSRDVVRELKWQKRCPRYSDMSAKMLGAQAGRLLSWAYELVDAGASVHDVRDLIALGIRLGEAER